jgi:transposase-like protein
MTAFVARDEFPEIFRGRTRAAAIFPNPESCLRLVSEILREISEAWGTSKAYLNPQLLK